MQAYGQPPIRRSMRSRTARQGYEAVNFRSSEKTHDDSSSDQQHRDLHIHYRILRTDVPGLMPVSGVEMNFTYLRPVSSL